MTTNKRNIYEIVTEKIIKEMEKGELPWRKPWVVGGSLPCNYITKKPYRGINVWLLYCEGRQNPYWLTFKQAQTLGGQVKKGEKGTLVVFWKWLERVESLENGESKAKQVPLLRYYVVFNVDQVEGLPEEAYCIKKQIEFEPIEACEKILERYKDRPEIKHEKQRAFYSPEFDYINLPRKESFESIPGYYGTFFHEVIHSTGHPKRLNRPGITELAAFGSPVYSKEELVAELGASFLCGLAGIELYTIANSSAYLQGWLQALKNDKRLLIQAAGQAQKAVDYILGETIEQAETIELPEIEYRLAA